MKDYIFLIIILLLRFPQNLFNKKLSGIVNGSGTYFLYGAYNYLLAGAVALAMMLLGGTYTISLPALGISALGALSLALNLYCSLEALKSGVMVLASLAGSAGLLLPCITGIFMFDEPMSAVQFIGIGLLIAVLALTHVPSAASARAKTSTSSTPISAWTAVPALQNAPTTRSLRNKHINRRGCCMHHPVSF